MGGASLKVIFDVVTAYPFEHNFQARKGDKERLPVSVKDAGSLYGSRLLSVNNGESKNSGMLISKP